MGRNADAIAEGVAIATAAARLAVKNHILVGTIAQGGTFDLDKYTEDTRQALEAMATESEDAAALTELRKKARGSPLRPFRHPRLPRPRRAQSAPACQQSIGVATKLREIADDPEAVRELVESAREAAWSDVRGNLDRRLRVEAMRPDQDPDYERVRCADAGAEARRPAGAGLRSSRPQEAREGGGESRGEGGGQVCAQGLDTPGLTAPRTARFRTHAIRVVGCSSAR